MKVICKQTTSQGFNLKEVTTIFSTCFDYSYGGYGLELNKEYIVMGIVTYQDSKVLYYLIDTNGKPDWFPYLLFDILENSIPPDWFMRINGKRNDTDIHTLYGFNELCNEEDFYDRLMERDEEAMRIYIKRKIEVKKNYGLF